MWENLFFSPVLWSVPHPTIKWEQKLPHILTLALVGYRVFICDVWAAVRMFSLNLTCNSVAQCYVLPCVLIRWLQDYLWMCECCRVTSFCITEFADWFCIAKMLHSKNVCVTGVTQNNPTCRHNGTKCHNIKD